MAIDFSTFTAQTTKQIWETAQKYDANFARITAKGTKDFFTERGWEALTIDDINTLNEFYGVSMRVGLQLWQVARAHDPLNAKGLVEVYQTAEGGYTQRLAVNSIKPVSPAFKNLVELESVDQQIVRKPKISERFFQQNENYQNFITIEIPELKTIMLNNTLGARIAGIMAQLDNAFTKQSYANLKQVIDVALKSEKYPAQDTQKIDLTVGDMYNMTDSELATFIKATKDLATSLDIVTSTSAYNAGKFDSYVPASDHIMLLRAGIKSQLEINLLVGAINPGNLTIPFEIVEVDNFGVRPYALDNDGKTKIYLYPAFNKIGEQIGYNSQPDQNEVEYTEDQVLWEDSHPDTIAAIFQKGAIFRNVQNPYQIYPAPFNARGMYQNYFANSMNNTIAYDYFYNTISINKESE